VRDLALNASRASSTQKNPLCSIYLSLIPALNAQIKRLLTLETTLFRFSQSSSVIARIAPYNNEEITSSNVEDDTENGENGQCSATNANLMKKENNTALLVGNERANNEKNRKCATNCH